MPTLQSVALQIHRVPQETSSCYCWRQHAGGSNTGGGNTGGSNTGGGNTGGGNTSGGNTSGGNTGGNNNGNESPHLPREESSITRQLNKVFLKLVMGDESNNDIIRQAKEYLSIGESDD